MHRKRNQFKRYSFVFICFLHQAGTKAVIQPTTTTTYNATKLLDCALRCRERKCDSFSFSKELHTCTIGVCVVTNSTKVRSTNVYLSCDEDKGFRVLTSGAVRACVWASTEQLNYWSARDDCRGKSSHLYTVKSVEKHNILKANFATEQWWVGLDDIVTEGTFRWVDDYTTSSSTWLSTIFDTGAGQPDNSYGNEDCVRTSWPSVLMYDVTCSLNTTYICEKSCFNFP